MGNERNSAQKKLTIIVIIKVENNLIKECFDLRRKKNQFFFLENFLKMRIKKVYIF